MDLISFFPLIELVTNNKMLVIKKEKGRTKIFDKYVSIKLLKISPNNPVINVEIIKQINRLKSFL